MDKQRSLFDAPPKPIEVNVTVAPEDRKRLSKQCRTILKRLIEGPASNDELSRIARKYTGRLSEIRQAGCVVVPENHGGGLWYYRLTYYPADLIGGGE